MSASKESAFDLFTPREKEVLALIASGHSSKQIADKLCISINTVGNHRSNMLLKTGAKSSAELVFIYISGYTTVNSD